ncbi:hypothetical protein [Raineyella fluvialis]|uniref:Uncharacterized protein n=1 Tax=Raineyella fluvialis TaxID=2662261 RepID=A0A5Q2F9F1_9ACTN|nr:hypothetical protein [Raineyella fluvialis]QGF23011.1 hypothetical protein Rai3103_04285 [Raineyella fluvialis]
MTTQTYQSIAETDSQEGSHQGLLQAGSAFLTIALIGVLLGALAANSVLMSVGALIGVVGAFILSCRELPLRRTE